MEYEARRAVLEKIQPLLIDDDFYRHEELVDKSGLLKTTTPFFSGCIFLYSGKIFG